MSRKLATGDFAINCKRTQQKVLGANLVYLQSPRVSTWAECDSFVLVAAINPCPCGFLCAMARIPAVWILTMEKGATLVVIFAIR